MLNGERWSEFKIARINRLQNITISTGENTKNYYLPIIDCISAHYKFQTISRFNNTTIQCPPFTVAFNVTCYVFHFDYQ